MPYQSCTGTIGDIHNCQLMVTMDLESITLYLVKKRLWAVTIHMEIHKVLGTGNVGHSIITGYLRQRD
jgi:hypothetical protein